MTEGLTVPCISDAQLKVWHIKMARALIYLIRLFFALPGNTHNAADARGSREQIHNRGLQITLQFREQEKQLQQRSQGNYPGLQPKGMKTPTPALLKTKPLK
jgi:hypothetical protein